MCQSCWEELGSPVLDSPSIRKAASLIKQVNEHSIVGGDLHIVVDDWNLEDKDLKFCHDQIAQGGYKPEKPDGWDRAFESTPEQLKIEMECCELLMSLSIPERASALAMYEGFFTPLNHAVC